MVWREDDLVNCFRCAAGAHWLHYTGHANEGEEDTGDMNLEEIIKTRRSIRKYREEDVPTEMLLRAVDLACWAPNGGNYQPWMFFVVKNRALIGRIADEVKEKTDIMASWPEAQDYAETMQRYQSKAPFFRSAPALIGAASAEYRSDADKVLRRRGLSDPMAAEMIQHRADVNSRVQTIAGAVAYLLLALHEMGLGACWMAGPMIARTEIEKMLEVPPTHRLFALVAVGYPAESPVAGPRKPRVEVVRLVE